MLSEKMRCLTQGTKISRENREKKGVSHEGKQWGE